MSTWEEEATKLREAGVPWQEVHLEAERLAEGLKAAGMPQAEIDSYFGYKDPAEFETRMEKKFRANVEAAYPAPPEPAANAEGVVPPRLEPQNFGIKDGFISGWQMSSTGLVTRGKMPDTLLPEEAGRFARIAHMAGMTIGDIPAMVAGAMGGAPAGAAVGAAAGSVVPGAGNVVGGAFGAVIGAGAGGMALPELIRSEYIDALTNGDVRGPVDFATRQGGVMWNTLKAGVIGGATFGAGKVAGNVAKGFGAGKFTAEAVTLGTELATMTTLSHAMEGELPTAESFIDGAIVLGGMKGAISASKLPAKARKAMRDRLGDRYARTGQKPEEAIVQAQTDPVLRGELQSPLAPKPLPGASISNTGATGVFMVQPLSAKQKVTAQASAAAATTPPLSGAAPKNAAETILSRVGEEDTTIGIVETSHKAYTEMFDPNHPINRIVDALSNGTALPDDMNPKFFYSLVNGASGVGEAMITRGVKGSKSLDGIIEQFKGTDRDGFKAYSIARWAIEKEGEAKETGVDLTAARNVIADGHKKYNKAFDDLQDYQNKLLSTLRDTSLLSDEAYTEITKNVKAYIPAYRLAEDPVTGDLSRINARGRGKGQLAYSPVKAFEGAESKIADPWNSILRNTMLFAELGARNVANLKLVDFLEPYAQAAKVREVKPIELSPSEMNSIAQKLGGTVPEGLDITIFRPNQRGLGENEITVFRGGKGEVWKIEDPEVARVLRGLDQQQLSVVDKFLRGFASAQRTMITLAPTFPVRQFFLDLPWAMITNEKPLATAKGFLSGYGHILGRSKQWEAWLKEGGGNSAFDYLEKNYANTKVLDRYKETDLYGGVWNAAKTPYHILRFWAEINANAPRVGRFAEGLKAGESTTRAAVEAREVGIDFKKIGQHAKRWNAFIPFFGAYLNGLAKSVKAVKDRPMQTATIGMAVVTLPTLMNWWAFKDEDWYKEQAEWKKDLGLMFPPSEPGGNPWFIPWTQPPFNLMFAATPRRLMEQYLNDNPDAWKDFEQTFGMGLAPPALLFTAYAPVVEHMANHSFFRDAPLEPDYLERGVLAPERYTPYSTETARNLSLFVNDLPLLKNFELSPPVIENYINGWGGSLGTAALKFSDMAIEEAGESRLHKPARTWADIPFLQSFALRYPSANTQSIDTFSDRIRKLEQINGSLERSLKTLDFGRWTQLAQQDSKGLMQLHKASKALDVQRKFVQNIDALPLDPASKRQLLDQTYGIMIMEARLGNTILDAMGVE